MRQIFFKQDNEFNVGNKYTFSDQDLKDAMTVAIEKVNDKQVNTHGLELKNKFSYKSTVDNILNFLTNALNIIIYTMPLYTFEHPNTGKTIDIMMGMNDDKTFIDENGLKWNRVFLSPNAAIDSNVDPFSSNDFVNKTNNKARWET